MLNWVLFRSALSNANLIIHANSGRRTLPLSGLVSSHFTLPRRAPSKWQKFLACMSKKFGCFLCHGMVRTGVKPAYLLKVLSVLPVERDRSSTFPFATASTSLTQ